MTARGLYLGLISGTSADGVDAALIDCEPSRNEAPRLLAAGTCAYPNDLRARVLALAGDVGSISLDDLGELDARIGEYFAEAALRLLADAGLRPEAVRALGSHGQTVRHRPSGLYPFTLQLGDAHRIAERTGIITVADFRRRDIAAGGQGAPLAPAFHAVTLSDPSEPRAVLNLGGIGNLTLLTPGRPVLGFDTGPGNCLMDVWIARHREASFDAGGAFAAQGRVDPGLLRGMLADPWFALPGPKSTGREQFDSAWLDAALDGTELTPEDVQASLCALTAETVAAALRRQMPECRRLLVCGGGAHNRALMAELAGRLPCVAVVSTAAHGLDPDFVEAMCFAWLAARTLAGLAGNLPEVTGAVGARVLGCVHPGRSGLDTTGI